MFAKTANIPPDCCFRVARGLTPFEKKAATDTFAVLSAGHRKRRVERFDTIRRLAPGMRIRNSLRIGLTKPFDL